MKFIKGYAQFINEGAYLDDTTGEVILTSRNDPNNKGEVLKTTGAQFKQKIHGISYFKDTPGVGLKLSSLMFPKFHSLDVDDYTGPIDHPGRFKYTMDQLKNANIVDAETSLPEFIRNSFNSLKITEYFRPAYLVGTGSTKGLVGKLCDAIQVALNQEIPVISLNKVKYLNAGDALDWDEVYSQVAKQASPTNPEGIKTLNIVKTGILHYIDRENTDANIIRAIRDANSVEELERLITGKGRYISPDTEIKWLTQINQEEMIPFIIRSSGRNAGGTKKFWKIKYDYHEKQFIEAVIDCLLSLKTATKKRMLIVDDNINTGDDVRLTKENIEAIIESMFPNSKEDQLAAKSLFGFYVLYDMGPTTNLEYTIDGDLDKKGKPTVYKKYPKDTATRDEFAQMKNLPIP